MNVHEIAHLHNKYKTGDKNMAHFSGEQLINCLSETIMEYGYFWNVGKDLCNIENEFELLAEAMHGHVKGDLFFASREKEDIPIEDIFDLVAQKLQNNT